VETRCAGIGVWTTMANTISEIRNKRHCTLPK